MSLKDRPISVEVPGIPPCLAGFNADIGGTLLGPTLSALRPIPVQRTERSSGDAQDEAVWRYIVDDYGPCGHHGIRADANAAEDDGPEADETVIANDDGVPRRRRSFGGSPGGGIVRNEGDAIRYSDMVPDLHPPGVDSQFEVSGRDEAVIADFHATLAQPDRPGTRRVAALLDKPDEAMQPIGEHLAF